MNVSSMPPDRTDLAYIDRLLDQTQAYLDDLQSRLSPLLLEQARADARLRLLKELRSTYEIGTAGTAPDFVEASPDDWSTGARTNSPSAQTVGARVQQQVRHILEDAGGGELSTQAIFEAFLKRGWKVPGAGRPGNISAHLTNADGILASRRGYWELGDSTRPTAKSRRRASAVNGKNS